jgi:hypothetical protein
VCLEIDEDNLKKNELKEIESRLERRDNDEGMKKNEEKEKQQGK